MLRRDDDDARRDAETIEPSSNTDERRNEARGGRPSTPCPAALSSIENSCSVTRRDPPPPRTSPPEEEDGPGMGSADERR